MSMFDQNRNPVIIPDVVDDRRRCPKCKGTNFGGRKVQGAITFTCRDCKNEWSGGLPREPLDPTIPRPPEKPGQYSIILDKNRGGQTVEERRSISLVQGFRTGALIPDPGEDDV